LPSGNRQIQPSEDPTSRVLAHIWRQAPVGLVLVADGAVAAWNPEARRLLEVSVGGRPTAWRRWLESAAVRLQAMPGAATVIEARQEHAPALELTAAGDDRREGMVVLVLREAAAGTASAAGRDLVETVSTLSHELRTPLASMKSSLSLVLGGDAGALNPDQSRFLGLALRNVTRLDRLVGDLLDISRDDAGRLNADCRVTDLGPVLREALAMFEDGGGQAGPRLDTSGIPAHFQACVDGDKIVQIVANLVGNARKYVPPEGRVRVWLDPHPAPVDPPAAELARACGLEARTFTLVVEDNGPGIDPQVVDRVFEPFERGRCELIGRVGGAGLGLHIVRRLAEAHGGKVSLATAPGAGTTIWVRLPVDPAGARLLQAAARLQADLIRGSGAGAATPAPRAGRHIALLDVRDQGAAAPAVVAAWKSRLQGLAPGTAGMPCEPAPGLLAVAVLDPARWDRAAPFRTGGWQRLEAVGSGAPVVPAPAFGGQPGADAVDSNSWNL
jgi:signal transduction histidine kinase